MIQILHIETATHICSVAISKNGQLSDSISEISDGYIHGEKLTGFIDDLLKRNNIEYKSLSAISVSAGPGSYTGLRIGISTAKGLCFGLNIPIISISSIQSLHEIAHNKYPEKSIAVLLDARRMEVYSEIYDASKSVLKKLSADVLAQNSYDEFLPLIIVGDANPKLKEFWANRNLLFDDEVCISASGQVDLSYQKYLAKDFEDLAYFTPNYLKEFYTH
jgi:tRNA threonylcarbamoyladenosine biosynthesis protein TsaB